MPSFSSLNTAWTGMRAAQMALHTISHNVANVGTEGYTRQRVDQRTLRPFDGPAGQMGAGVDVEGISRRRDAFLDERVRSETALEQSLQQRADLLARAENLFGSLDGSINDDLAAAFSAFEDLALRPDNAAARETARSSLEALTGRFNSLSNGTTRLAETVGRDLEVDIDQVNQLARDVAAMNREIVAAGVNGSPNDLLDARDRKLDELAQLAGATVRLEADGSARVLVDGLALVDDNEVYELTLTGTDVTHPHGDPDLGGSLAGVQDFLDNDITGIRTDLDTFAVELRDAFNAGNAAGFVGPGTPGPDLLSGTDAASLAVAITDGSQIATAAADPPAAFDGSNAQAIADLRNVDLPSGGTPLERFQDLLTDLGARTAGAITAADRQSSIATSASLAREGEHGVSVDEEMAQLVQYQRAIEASARVMSTLDEALATIISRTGRVGL